MKKRKFAIITLAVLFITLVVYILPFSVIAAETTGSTPTVTKLTASDAGKTLSGNYYVEAGTTLTLRGSTGSSGLKVATNKTLTIHIPAGSTLYVYGGAASGTTGAGAGIEVNSGSTLIVTGEGKLYAYGGKGANGANGGNGENANYVDDGTSYIPDGGYGGAGGGGAGAGIGTKGGNGGSGAGWTRGFNGGLYKKTDNFMDINYSGPNGAKGGNGTSANACGAIYISADVEYSATGGAAGTSGGSGGSRGSSDGESDDSWKRGIAGGAGGGGGGAGKAGASIGTGGGGGGGGGAGGGVGYAWSYRYLGAGGGGGGAGAVGGSGGAWGPDGEIADCKKFQYYGGVERYSSSGSSGSTSSGGSGGQGAKIKITDWDGDVWQYPYAGYGGSGGSAGNNYSTVAVQKLYDVTISVEDEIIGTYYASENGFLPESLEVPYKSGYTFDGFFANDIEYYDINGLRTDAKITADTEISAIFTANSYNIGIKPSEGSVGGGADLSGPINYGDAITLTTPSRDGYLFRGWKISATSGSINEDAYYVYSSVAPSARMLRSSGLISSSLVHNNGFAMTAGFEKIGSSITLYNLSADPNAELTIEEVWVENSFTVTFKDFNGTVLGTDSGRYGDSFDVPALPNNQNEYYDYTFKYWKCNIDGQYYTSDQLPYLGYFLDYEDECGDEVYYGVTFTAVYEISDYKKELHLEGFLGNTDLDENGMLVLNSNSTNVDVITNFKITKNDGLASLLLIPKYDASAFTIKSVSVNGVTYELGGSASSSAVLSGFEVTFTGGNGSEEAFKILLDSLTPDAATSEEIFIQIVYVMSTAIGGEYEFGFVTNTPTDTDNITHGDRSEAYGTYDPDAGDDKNAWEYNELEIVVDSTAIKVVIRATGEIIINPNQSFVYNGQQMSAAEISEMIEKVLQYQYNGFAKKKNDTITIKWYDAQGNELREAPKNVGTYKIGISAAETAYYTEVIEVIATFTITPYELYVGAGNQSFEYTGSNIVIDTSASNNGLFIKDENGDFIPADEFVNSEIVITGVLLNGEYVNVGEYTDAIQAGIQYIGNGLSDNYTVIYKSGTLTITKADNSWINAPADKTDVYSGSSITINSVTSKFGSVKIEYLIGFTTDASGNKVDEWSTEAPKNAGIYTVKITVEGNDNYYGLAEEVTLTITKKVISADGFTFEAIDKTYNGESQYWSLDPNGDDNISDKEVEIIASGDNALILQYVKFAGMRHPMDCTNAGTYVINAILEISNPNYTFISEGKEVDSWTYDVEVVIHKLKIVVDANDQSSEYTGSVPTLSQGKDFLTITLENGAAAPDFINRDFFGGIRYVYRIANEYDATAVYYKIVDGNYVEVTLTKEEFEANKALSGDEGGEDYVEYYTLITINPETLIISTNGINVGEYAIIATLGENSNYEITLCNGTFNITKKLIPVPELGILVYNGQNQTPKVPLEYEGIYEYIGEGKDVGVYILTAVLLDKDNYAWENVISVNVGSLPTNESFTVSIEDRLINLGISDINMYTTVNFKVSGERYAYTTISATSEDILLPWYIDQKTLILVYPDATQTFEYGTFVTDIVNSLGDPIWKDGVAPFEGDENTEVYRLNVNYSHSYPTVGTNYLLISQGMFNTNYKVLVEGGKVDITKKILTQKDLADNVSVLVKDYTGNVLVLDLTSDFIIGLNDYNNALSNVFGVIVVDTKNHINANGYKDDTAFVYHDEENGKIYVTVTVELLDNDNYELATGVNTTFDVEAYIAKAENQWTSEPSVDSSNINDVSYYAKALFGNVIVQYYMDEDCRVPVTGTLQASVTYYAKFTVEGNNNHYGLESIIVFSADHITIIKPIVRVDSTTGSVAAVGEKVTITYDGLAHGFIVPEKDVYVVNVISAGEWKNAGTYQITVALADSNYVWNDGTQSVLTYTLVINKKTLTIIADNKDIVFGDNAPEYSVTTSGLVEGETFLSLLSSPISSYISCSYTAGNNVGNYDITVLDTIKDELSNYDVFLKKGALRVNKLAYDYTDIELSDGKTLYDLINSGLTFIYDSQGKEVDIEDIPGALKVILTYKDANGNVLSVGEKPTNAGAYSVEITVSVNEGYFADNYKLPNDATITLNIEKATITITVDNQGYDYTGNDLSGKVSLGKYTITVNNGSALEDTVVLKLADGTYENANVYADAISVNHTYDESNYTVVIDNGDFVIRKVNNSWTDILNVRDNIVYNSAPLVNGLDYSSASQFGTGDIKYSFYEKVGNTWVSLSGIPTHAGIYAVEARVDETDNYYAIASDRVEFTIEKAKITIDGISFVNTIVTYNGSEHYVYASGEKLDLFNVVYSGDGKVNVGEYTVTASFSPIDEQNYELIDESTLTAILKINAVTVTITVNNQSSIYGNTINPLTYTIDFGGEDSDNTFYVNEFGRIVLSTSASSQSNVGVYPISISYTKNSNYAVAVIDGTYTITKYVGNTVSVSASHVRYLMDLIYSATADRGQDTVVFTFATSEAGPYTSELPKNVGTYYVKATVEDTANYEGCVSAPVRFEIQKAILSAISNVTYNKDTATWSAVVTTTDGKTIDCDVLYLVDNNKQSSTSFQATETGVFTVIAEPSGVTAFNYEASEPITLATVYSLEFTDKAENHEKQPNLADLTASAFKTQYRFEGQAATRPDAIPTVNGYTFREWMIGSEDYNFALGVSGNITLYASWTINTYTIYFYNEVVTGSKIENGIFVEGEISTVLLDSKTFVYGDQIVFIDGVPTKAEDMIYKYTFAYWADALRGDEVADTYVVTDNASFYAVYTGSARDFTITYMVSVDGGSYFVQTTVTAPYGSQLIALDDVRWFISDVWYTDEGRNTSAPTFVPAEDMTLYGAYVFDIGAGDVNADGEIDVDDITLYRRWIVGGYNIVSVAPGSEWDLVNSDSFSSNTLYFVERVNDANRDDSGDIRDITTVRMALTGGYGYTYVSGLDSRAGVSGEAVIIEKHGLISVDTTESFKAALEQGGVIQLTSDITFDETITISEDTVIYLNGHELDMSANVSRPFEMASNTRLVIYAENATVKVGNYGLVNIPVGTDNVEVILNGGSYIANTDNGAFIKPRGEGKISIELNNVTLTDSSARNFAIHTGSYTGDDLSVKVLGGEYNVWCGFSVDGRSGNEYLIDGTTINCRYSGITAGGHDIATFSPDAAAHVTVKNCTINVEANGSYSADMACIVAGYGAQVEVINSNLNSNVHIASICSGNGNCTIKLNNCQNSAGQEYEQYKFFDNGSIQVDGVEQAQ